MPPLTTSLGVTPAPVTPDDFLYALDPLQNPEVDYPFEQKMLSEMNKDKEGWIELGLDNGTMRDNYPPKERLIRSRHFLGEVSVSEINVEDQPSGLLIEERPLTSHTELTCRLARSATSLLWLQIDQISLGRDDEEFTDLDDPFVEAYRLLCGYISSDAEDERSDNAPSPTAPAAQLKLMSYTQARDALTLLQETRDDPGSPLRSGFTDEDDYSRIVLDNLVEHFPELESDAVAMQEWRTALTELSEAVLIVINAFILAEYSLNVVRIMLAKLRDHSTE